jgi:hypothetical protein
MKKRNGVDIIPLPYFVFVNSKSDLPTPSSGIITLLDNYTYFFTTTVDLTGDRLVCGVNTTILGASSENCRIKSTGMGSTPLIESSYSLPMRNITIESSSGGVAQALFLSGDNTASSGTTAIDWFGVNFTDCPIIGTIRNYTNVIMTDCAFINSANLIFDGTIGSIGLSTCLFDGRSSSSTTFTLQSTLNLTRRFRIIYSSFVTDSGQTSINVNAGATVSNDGYILTYCNFGGGSTTHLVGVTQSSNKTLFINNVGITNTSNVGHYYMQNNATTTGIVTQNVFVKAPGTTIEGIGNSPKWSHSNNRLAYTGTINSEFIITVSGSLITNTTNNTIGVGISKNGAQPDVESRVSVRCAQISTAYPFQLQDVIQVAFSNYFEIWLANENGTNAITLSDVNVIIQKITG